jgi:hypothetical protein
MASTVSLPMPGMLNTVSVTTTPPMRRTSPIPITETMGTAALRSA